jgi:hypothetical protein
MQAGGGLPAREPQAMAVPGAEDYTNLQRVKVYRLNDSGHWDDKGTGHVSCEYMEVRAPLSRSPPPSPHGLPNDTHAHAHVFCAVVIHPSSARKARAKLGEKWL